MNDIISIMFNGFIWGIGFSLMSWFFGFALKYVFRLFTRLI